MAARFSPNPVGNGFAGGPDGSVNDIEDAFATANFQIEDGNLEGVLVLIALLPFEANSHVVL